MQQRDADRLPAGGHHRIDGAIDARHIEWCHHGAIRGDALAHLCDVAALHERFGFIDVEIIGLVALLPPDQQDVTREIGTDKNSAISIAVAGILIVVLAPLSEELFVRRDGAWETFEG